MLSPTFTIFTTCRPFNMSQFGVMQRNALRSWAQLRPVPEVLVMGNEQGVEEICKELGYRQVEVQYEGGVPRLDDMIIKAEQEASNHYIALVSSDVLLFQTVYTALCTILDEGFTEFCAVCRKMQQRKIKPLDFSNNWREVVMEGLRLNLMTSGDFYMFTKGFWGQLPPFVIGRCYCDSYLFYIASQKKAMIDISEVVQIIDYQHGHPHVDNKMRETEGWKKNLALYKQAAGEKKTDLRAANWKINTSWEIVKA